MITQTPNLTRKRRYIMRIYAVKFGGISMRRQDLREISILDQFFLGHPVVGKIECVYHVGDISGR